MPTSFSCLPFFGGMASTLPATFPGEDADELSQAHRRAFSLGIDVASMNDIAQEVLLLSCSPSYSIHLCADRLIVNRCGDGVYFAIEIKEPDFPVLYKPHLTVCRKALYSGPDAWSQFHRTVFSLKRLLGVGRIDNVTFYPHNALLMVCEHTALYELMQELREVVESKATTAEFPAGGWHVSWNIAL